MMVVRPQMGAMVGVIAWERAPSRLCRGLQRDKARGSVYLNVAVRMQFRGLHRLREDFPWKQKASRSKNGVRSGVT